MKSYIYGAILKVGTYYLRIISWLGVIKKAVCITAVVTQTVCEIELQSGHC